MRSPSLMHGWRHAVIARQLVVAGCVIALLSACATPGEEETPTQQASEEAPASEAAPESAAACASNMPKKSPFCGSKRWNQANIRQSPASRAE